MDDCELLKNCKEHQIIKDAIADLPKIKDTLVAVTVELSEIMSFLKGRLGTKGFETEIREQLWVIEGYISEQKARQSLLIEEEKERKKQRNDMISIMVGTIVLNLLITVINHFWK